MAVSDDSGEVGGLRSSAAAFALVWIVGILLSFVSFSLAMSGRLWDWGVPVWLITLTMLVGIWQWVWIAPILRFARHRNRHALYNGLLGGGISFSAIQLGIFVILYLMLRKFSLQ